MGQYFAARDRLHLPGPAKLTPRDWLALCILYGTDEAPCGTLTCIRHGAGPPQDRLLGKLWEKGTASLLRALHVAFRPTGKSGVIRGSELAPCHRCLALRGNERLGLAVLHNKSVIVVVPLQRPGLERQAELIEVLHSDALVVLLVRGADDDFPPFHVHIHGVGVLRVGEVAHAPLKAVYPVHAGKYGVHRTLLQRVVSDGDSLGRCSHLINPVELAAEDRLAASLAHKELVRLNVKLLDDFGPVGKYRGRLFAPPGD
mmetsp:Transcript_27335/g.80423  ORF Transcript_27335/g.80423 Transcript_27335/m.80423 type:complete len:258 (+) Transcript_27335:34-807(+)